MRGNVKGNARTAEDVLNAYTRDNYGKFIIVKQIERGRILAELGNGKEVDESITRSSIMGRVEHGFTPGYIDYYIEESMLKACCASMSYGYADFKRKLGMECAVTPMPKKDLTAKTRGPQMRVSVLKISRPITDLEDDDPLSMAAA
jgi:hypothetical protein